MVTKYIPKNPDQPRKYTKRNAAGVKSELLALARDGHKRPHHNSYLGNRLEAYISVNRNYDEQFASQIKFIAPHWFPEFRTKKNKLLLLNMARSGQPIPEKNTTLRKQLNYYMLKGHSHDPVFAAEIRKYWN